MNEFSRLKLLLKDKYDLLKNKKVLIIGLGGVGGYALESITRTGISNLIIVDNDIIEESNLNRQLIALKTNIGKYKTDEFESRILNINPSANVKKINEFILEDNIDLLFDDNVDYIIDACDTVKTKCLIIKKCIEKNIKFISCMGTGRKIHPEMLKITDLSKTNYDPIAKKIRKFAKDNKIIKKIPVVSSDEVPFESSDEAIPSISFVPAVAGMLLASYVINDIISGD